MPLQTGTSFYLQEFGKNHTPGNGGRFVGRLESLSVNVFINTQIEMEKLELHTPDKKMHVGKSNVTLRCMGHPWGRCQKTYLGDIISYNGSNQKNITSRVGKGLGITSQVINILETVSFGRYFF